MTLSIGGCGAADAARLVDADGPASTEIEPKAMPPTNDACCARKPTRAWISYEAKEKEKKGTVRRWRGEGTEEGAWRGLTMEGVRRSSCSPRPPRMTVLLVSMMTTLESRKPMLLIALIARERDEHGPTDN